MVGGFFRRRQQALAVERRQIGSRGMEIGCVEEVVDAFGGTVDEAGMSGIAAVVGIREPGAAQCFGNRVFGGRIEIAANDPGTGAWKRGLAIAQELDDLL